MLPENYISLEEEARSILDYHLELANTPGKEDALELIESMLLIYNIFAEQQLEWVCDFDGKYQFMPMN